MAERGMGSAVGQVPEYIEMSRLGEALFELALHREKLTPNVTSILPPAMAAKRRRGGCGQPDQHGEIDHQR